MMLPMSAKRAMDTKRGYEDINPENNELWGNFPQTCSLVGLVNCAMKLSKTWEDVV